jgi:hypothetical protein
MSEDTIKINLKEIRLEAVDWIHLDQCRALVNTVINLRVS